MLLLTDSPAHSEHVRCDIRHVGAEIRHGGRVPLRQGATPQDDGSASAEVRGRFRPPTPSAVSNAILTHENTRLATMLVAVAGCGGTSII